MTRHARFDACGELCIMYINFGQILISVELIHGYIPLFVAMDIFTNTLLLGWHTC